MDAYHRLSALNIVISIKGRKTFKITSMQGYVQTTSIEFESLNIEDDLETASIQFKSLNWID